MSPGSAHPTGPSVPKFDELLGPVLRAVAERGGSASNAEIAEQIIQDLGIRPEVAEEAHLGSLTQTELEYRLAWARTYLRKAGLLENSARGIWVVTPSGRAHPDIDPKEITRAVRALDREPVKPRTAAGISGRSTTESETPWEEKLLETLYKLEPSAFERLCQRMLRESGFEDVEVTGRSGDGGIDGIGILQIGGLLTEPIAFQSKRYQGSVGVGPVRDFRGAISGRAERGLLITTGRFTRDAIQEATRRGAQRIDLVDGFDLARRLRDLGLGVRRIESAEVDERWFEEI